MITADELLLERIEKVNLDTEDNLSTRITVDLGETLARAVQTLREKEKRTLAEITRDAFRCYLEQWLAEHEKRELREDELAVQPKADAWVPFEEVTGEQEPAREHASG